MTALQRALEPGAPAPGGGGEQISMILGADAPVAGTLLMRSESAIRSHGRPGSRSIRCLPIGERCGQGGVSIEHLIGGGQLQYPPHRGTAHHDP